jgi:hypothetical protein
MQSALDLNGDLSEPSAKEILEMMTTASCRAIQPHTSKISR